jgi:basic amino acid/polyamine antiporter, APA family
LALQQNAYFYMQLPDSLQYQPALKREIGISGIAANTLNRTIGAGIFVLPALVAGILGESSLYAYLICGALMLTIVLCFAEIGSYITTSGGGYAYIHAAFGSFAGFIANSLFWFVGVMADAAVANAMANTLAIKFPALSEPLYRGIFFFCMFAMFAFVNIRGVKYGNNMVKINTFIKLIPLLLLIVAGIFGNIGEPIKVGAMPSLEKLGEASLLLFFAFAGGEASLNVSGEVKNPKRAVPLGILLGMGAVILIYILIQIAAQGVLGAALIQYKEAPLAAVAEKIFGGWGGILIIAGAAFSMFAALSGSILSYPRILFAGAERGWMPPFIATIHPEFATPIWAIVTYSLFDFIGAMAGGFKQLAVISSAAMLTIYLGVALATIKLRISNTSIQKEGFRLPFGLTIPMVAVVAILWFLSNLEKNELMSLVLFLAFLSVTYFGIEWWKKQKMA